MKKQKIFLIGGGEINRKETVKIDKIIIRLGGGSNAKILFFPTAAVDSNNYIKDFKKYFSSLGCKFIATARLSKEAMEEIKYRMATSTIIYLGGGSTETLISLFRKNKIATELKKCLKKGTIIVGMSAGAAALCDISIITELNERLRFKRGLGIINNLIVIPHFHNRFRNKLKEIKRKFSTKKIITIKEKEAVYLVNGKVKKIIS